jgi:hypothetical protein
VLRRTKFVLFAVRTKTSVELNMRMRRELQDTLKCHRTINSLTHIEIYDQGRQSANNWRNP